MKKPLIVCPTCTGSGQAELAKIHPKRAAILDQFKAGTKLSVMETQKATGTGTRNSTANLLQALVADGLLVRQEIDGVWHYSKSKAKAEKPKGKEPA